MERGGGGKTHSKSYVILWGWLLSKLYVFPPILFLKYLYLPRFQVSLTSIKSSNQYRIPGPIASVVVKCLPVEPGEIFPPQHHLRMTLVFDGNNIRKMLIPLWVSLMC